MTNKIKYKKKYEELANGWAVRNLKEYGNTTIPTEVIKFFESEKEVAYLLSMIMHEPIKVRYAETAGYIAEVVMI